MPTSGFDVVVDAFDALPQGADVGIGLAAVLGVEEAELVDVRGSLQVVEAFADGFFELAEVGAEAPLFPVAFVVHAASPLPSDLVGPGGEGLFQRGA
ncbi:MAG: hypothetical protein ACRDY7_13815 [Acidimicrobiia bacterium]